MLEALGPIQYLRRIIIHEMQLAEDRVIVYNQKYTLPTDENLFVVVEFKTAKPYSSRTTMEEIDSVQTEVQVVNMQEHYTIGIFSRNLDALQRKHEIGMAMGSFYAQQLQEAGSFKVARISPIQDLSPLEATALLYRFDVDLVVLAWYEKTKAAGYYETFPVEVDVVLKDDDTTQIEFEQPTEELP